jgi:hypothetical protein
MIMATESDEFRQQLLNVETVSPPLRDAYRKEVDAMLHPPMAAKSSAPGITLLVLLVGCTILIVRADLIYHVRSLLLIAHMALAIAFAGASGLIIRDLRKWKHSQQSASSVANLLTLAAGTVTVIALIRGLRAPGDPKSLFGAFYVFVFYFACAVWSLERRIASSELASREQSLRIECRILDLAERSAR